MLRLLSIPAALIVLLVGVMVWSSHRAPDRADFVCISQRDVNTLDINQMSYMQDIRITYAIREGLYMYNGMTLDPEPAVAKSVDISPDKLVYTFHLRPEAKWSNGDPVTAYDFLFAWRRMLESPAEYTYLHYYIKGAEKYVNDFADNKPVDIKTVGEEALDPLTLRVTLHDPVPFIFDLMAYTPFYPLNEKSMEPFKKVDKASGRITYDQSYTRPPKVVTNGAFNLVSWEFKRRLRLQKNPYYWDKANVKSNTIQIDVVEDPLTQVMRYDSGDADWLAAVPSEVAPEMLEKGRKDLRNFAGFGTEYLMTMVLPKFINGTANPLADKRVRQALAMTIDKDYIVKNITRMGEQPTSTFIPANIYKPLGWRSTPGLPFDPERARKLLDEAGYPNGKQLPGVSFLYRSGLQTSKDEAQYLVRQWKQKLNLDIPMEQQEPKIVRDRLHKQDFALCVSDWIGDYNDPSTFTDMFQTNSDNNTEKWSSAASTTI